MEFLDYTVGRRFVGRGTYHVDLHPLHHLTEQLTLKVGSTVAQQLGPWAPGPKRKNT